MTFTLTFVNNSLNSDTNTFAACVNACISVLNRAGINQKHAPFAAMTLQFDNDGSVKTTDFKRDSKSTLVDLVCDTNCNVLHLETMQGSNALDFLMDDEV